MKTSPPGAEFGPTARKTFHSALGQLLQKEFPRTFGPQVTRLFADRVDELCEKFHPPRSRLKMGQVLWVAVAVDDPPGRSKRIEDSKLVPVILDLVTEQEIEEASEGTSVPGSRPACAFRLFRQAYEQGGVLAAADVALLLHMSSGFVNKAARGHERATKEVIPRRGTIHDLGPSLTHKRIICYKRLVEKKSTSQVAEETMHSPEAVERYVQSLRRVQLCRDSGMDRETIAQATGHSHRLVQEYLDLMQEFGM